MALTLNLLSFTRPTDADIIARESLSAFLAPGNDQSFRAKFAPDGRYSVFYSLASNLLGQGVDTNNQLDIFRKDLKTGEIIRVSTHVGGTQISAGVPTDAYELNISPDGRYVLFSTTAKLLSEDNNGLEDVYMKDLATQAITRVTDGGGALAPYNGSFIETYNGSANARFSPDGKYVVFESNRLVHRADANDPNDRYQTDVFRKNLATGQIDRISIGPNGQQGQGHSWDAKYTPDGRYVIFSSIGGFDPAKYDGATQILRKDLQTGALHLVSADALGNRGGDHSLDAQISADGRYVVFASMGRKLVLNDTNEAYDIFRKDLYTGAIVRVSTSRTGEQSNGESRAPQISADGRYVVFTSKATNLVPNDTNNAQDVFRKDMVTGEIARLSATATGAQGQGNATEADSYNPQISADGRFVSFDSFSGLVPYDAAGTRDVHVVDTLLKDNFGAVHAQRFVELSFEVGQASSVSIAWGDGTSSTVLPKNGVASFNHSYATAGTKTAVVTVNEGGQTKSVSYSIDPASGQIVRNATTDTQTGNTGVDVLTGDAFGNILSGGAGNDVLNGMEGHDRLVGGAGKDVLTGGTGKDIFVFDTRPNARTNVDRIVDFRSQDDSFQLDNKVFTKLGSGTPSKPKKFKADMFVNGKKAQDPEDRIVYDRKTGSLYYDQDGTGSKAQVKIATLGNKAKLYYHDFFVI